MTRPNFVRRVEKKLDEVASPEFHRRYAESDVPPGDVEELVREQRREADEVAVIPAVGARTGPQARGMVVGALLGALVGALVLLPVAFVPMFDLALPGRLLITTIVGAVAGMTIGAVYGGGRGPELGGESVDADGTPSVGSSLRDPGADEHGRST